MPKSEIYQPKVFADTIIDYTVELNRISVQANRGKYIRRYRLVIGLACMALRMSTRPPPSTTSLRFLSQLCDKFVNAVQASPCSSGSEGLAAIARRIAAVPPAEPTCRTRKCVNCCSLRCVGVCGWVGAVGASVLNRLILTIREVCSRTLFFISKHTHTL